MAYAKAVDAPSSPGPAKTGTGGNPWLVLLAVSLGVIMVMLDGTVVGIANPIIQADLKASLSDLQWVTSGYLLALAVFLITAGKLGDLFGHKRVFLIGVAGFALSSVGIGLSAQLADVIPGVTPIGALIGLRVLQGLFGALLQPAALALLRSAFPGEKLNQAMGAWGAIIGLSSAAGPIVGGLLVESRGWEFVFFINAPVGVIALVMGFFLIKENRAQSLSRIDWLGVLLLSGAMFSLVWTIIKAPEWGWGDSTTLTFVGAFVVLIGGFIFWQSRARQPLVPLSLFRNVSISIGTVLMMMVAFAMFGAMFFLGFFFQGVHGLSPLEAGLRMLPMSAGMIVASPLAGMAIGRLGPKITMAAGLLITAFSMFLMSQLSIDASFIESGIPFLLLAFGLSPVFVGATEIIVGNAPMELSGVAGGLQQSAMQVGGALGTAILGAVMAAQISSTLPGHLGPAAQAIPADQLEGLEKAAAFGVAPPGAPQQIVDAVHFSFMDGMHVAFLVSTGIAVLTALLTLFVKSGRKSEGAPVHMG
ncbi:DHA2 family efflux MFS transporter permease subunit [Nonomuraea basaltis]|uniref:DHA2 family efflux MFS transporter permease subunit n=1 Tax=Nonomuraea basaltis TaxID=2495887 RepID=UPI00110C5345|nr:DHA2 family efflux MFS transporter permease subunit [Nonomuraea basaltis]TMR95414.1 DHA2 family efflux MFS transporter permease subunit [Nonomuraea basaltis]